MSDSSSGPSGAIVWGNDQGQAFFLDSANGQVLGQATLMYGNLTAPARIRNVVAFFGEGATQGTTFLHAFDLSDGRAIKDLWDPGIQLSGSVDAAPVVIGNTLYAATSAGVLLAYEIGEPDQPSRDWQLDVMGLSTGDHKTVTGLVRSAAGAELYLVTAAGLYGVAPGTDAGRVIWKALTTKDFTAVRARLDGKWLIAASGKTVYGFDTTADPSSGDELSPAWNYETGGQDVVGVYPLGREQILCGDGGGAFHILDSGSGEQLNRFELDLPAGAAARTRFVNNQLVSLSTSGDVCVNEFIPTESGGITTTEYWRTTAGPGFDAPPAVIGRVVYGIGTDNKLYALDLGAKSELFSAAIGGSGSASFAAPSFSPLVDQAADAKVRFLLDGENYFHALRDLLIAVANGSLSPPGSLPDDLTIEGLVKAVGKAGNDAYVMMWNSSMIYGLLDEGKNWTRGQLLTTLGAVKFEELFTPTGALRGDHRLNAQTYLALKDQPNVHVFLEPYELKSPYWYEIPFAQLGSNHQKIGIFSIGGAKFALASGFNTITPSYYDTTAHPMEDGDSYTGHSWHDTGLLLQGDAVDLIEAEFDRRWSKQGAPPSPGSGTYVKFANWMIARNSCLGPSDACKGSQTPAPYADPSISTDPVPTQILITSNETVSPNTRIDPRVVLTDVAQIRDQLVAYIGQASKYVYFENFTFQEMAIIRALAERLERAPADFKIIVMVPHPTVQDAVPDAVPGAEKGQFPLIRSGYIALKLSSNDWDSFWYLGEHVSRTDVSALRVNWDDRGIERTTITFTKRGTTRTVRPGEIWRIHEGDGSPQVIYCAAARYFSVPPPDRDNSLLYRGPNFRRVTLHSKLALVDDEKAVVGSANFSRRSMRNDGELSVFVNDPTTALQIRKDLFGHWNMNTADDWVDKMNAFAQTTEESLGVLPIEGTFLPDPPPTWASSFLTAVLDPSVLF